MARACFALGNIFRDRGEPAEAFACYRRANAIRDRDFPWTSSDEEAWFEGLTSTFTAPFFDARKGFGVDSERPLFIVGMPRSGTSLIEQIIASHPEVAGGGELSDIRSLADAPPSGGTGLPFPRSVMQLTERMSQNLAKRYLGKLDDISSSAKHVTDKLPDNYQYLGIIALLLPRARVIFCRRDPMATCLSIYQQDFTGYHPYAYDLAKLGRRYRNHEHLLDHWRRVLPLRLLEVTYEDVVADQEGQSRRIMEFCGLEWTPQVLDFHRTARPVRTVSRWQVRQPIYRDAVDGWRAYEPFLGPLKDALGPS